MDRAELEQRLRERIRLQGKSRKTANTYWHWTRRYLDFNRSHGTGRETRAERAVEAFLSHLANREHVSANTQNQAFSALCYLYRHVFERPLENVSALRSKRPNRTREVCDQSELVEIFRHLSGFPLLACQLMYGCGLRIGEAVSLRLKDLHFERRQMHIWDGKGKKDRMVQLPECLHDDLRRQVERVRLVWEDDRQNNRPGVPLPGAFGRKSPRSQSVPDLWPGEFKPMTNHLPSDPANWDGNSDFVCPHCSARVPYSEGMEEFTVGSLIKPNWPHFICPTCGDCCACSKSTEVEKSLLINGVEQ